MTALDNLRSLRVTGRPMSGMVEGEVERAVAMLRTMPTRQMPIDRDGHPIVAKGQA